VEGTILPPPVCEKAVRLVRRTANYLGGSIDPEAVNCDLRENLTKTILVDNNNIYFLRKNA
jgi:hypothetical protein